MTETDRPTEGNDEREYVLRLRTPDEPSQDLPREGCVRVIVEDVGLLDEPSAVVAEAAAQPGPPAATLGVRAALRPRHQYSVRVHVDRGGDGVVRPGDLVGAAGLDGDTPSSQRIDVHLTRVLDEPAD